MLFCFSVINLEKNTFHGQRSGDPFCFKSSSSDSFKFSDTINLFVDVSLSFYKNYNCKQSFGSSYNNTIHFAFVIYDCQFFFIIEFMIEIEARKSMALLW